jgi:hypothetical protein
MEQLEKLNLTEHAQVLAGVAAKLLERTEDVDSLRTSDALEFLLASKELAALARDIVRVAEQLLIDAMGGKSSAVIDGHPVEVRRGYNRKWDQGMLVGAIAASVLEGERIPEVDRVVKAIAGALYASTQWSVTALKDMGIDDARYCERELGKPTVQVR